MIDVAAMSFTYTGSSSPAVVDLSFAVAPGEIFGLLGPSGAGKSTTQRVLLGLLRGYLGRARVGGKEVREWTSDDYERIGVSFETPNHFSRLTGLENLRYFGALYSHETRDPGRLLEAVALEDDGDRRVEEYSRGMRGRLGIARSLIGNPRLLFLDEPTSGLDPVNAQRIRDLIRAEREAGCTVFLTTHDMVAADDLCDRVAFIVDGRIAAVDSPRTLRLEHGERTVRVEFRGDAGTAHADFPLDGIGLNPDFQRLLREREVETIHTREASLAGIFIRITGRNLS
jgi:fluoroquinolone transport system ATP-binding protein